MQVKELMLKHVITVNENDTIESLIHTFLDHKISGVPVLNDREELTGFVSDGDILRAVSPKPPTIYEFFTMIQAVEVEMTRDKLQDVLEQKVKRVMRKHALQTVTQDQELDAVLKILSHNHYKKIPVINNKRKVTGIVCRRDVIQLIGNLAVEKRYV